MDAPPPIANMLRLYRKQKGLRQIDVAHRLGFTSPDRISLWEKGRAFPSLTNLFKLSALYGVPAEELYRGLFETIQAKFLVSEHFPSPNE
jgi:transcriptional regulator with XRE-family HTH domain